MNKRPVGAVAALLLLLVAASTATANQVDLDDLILPSAAAIAKSPAIPGVQLSAKHQLAVTSSVATDAPAGAIGALEIQADDIAAPASISSGRLTIGAKSFSSVQTLTIEGRTFDLVPVDQAIDEKFGLRVVTMRVLNVPESYARFTVAMDGAVVGTLVTPGSTYRIASVKPGKQFVYRMAPNGATQVRSAARDDKLERRHVQLEQLAAIGPELAFSSEQGGTLVLIGGRLGKIPQGQVTSRTLAPILRSVSDLAFQSRIPDIRVTFVARKPAGGRIEFEQTIGGIPVLARNVIVFAPDGTVLELRTNYVDPGRAKSYQPNIGLKRAIMFAQEALERHLQKKLGSVELLNDARLRYRSAPSSRDLLLEYQLDVGTQRDGNWIVTVDAYDGTTIVEDSRMFGTAVYGHVVCRDNSSTQNPVKCNQAGAQIIWNAEYQGASSCGLRDQGTNICTTAEPNGAHQALLQADTVLGPIDTASPAYCCDKLGGPPATDHTIDVNVNSGAWPTDRVSYDRATGTIVSGISDQSLANYEIVWHELGHHVVHMYNAPMANAGSLTVFEGLFNEGIADTFSAAIADSLSASTRFANPWIIGDGLSYPNGVLVRDCTDSSIDFRILTNTSAPANEQNHVRGTGICVFFIEFSVTQILLHEDFWSSC